MTSCMLAGDRRLAPARKSGMTVLGKVPKPINLPSQKLENQGNDPNVEIVPKGTLTWGSRPSSTVTNAWGTSSISSLNADGSLGSPGTRPSTAGSDRSHEPFSNAWGQNSRPSSASGILASGQLSASSSRPRSAETRPGSSQLSRFADNSVDKPVAWGAARTPERLGSVSSKDSGFNLSSGDFPTLGSDKNSDTNSQRGHSSQGRPLSSQGRPLSSHNLPTSLSSPESRDFIEPHLTGDNIDQNQGTVNSWKADDPQYALHGPPPNMDHWHRDLHQAPPYPNMNIPPPHYGSWHNPQYHPGPADGSWYNRGRPPGGPYRQPSPPGNYPVDYPPGPPRPLYYEPYSRPYMQPDRYMGPSHPDIRPGAYPRPMPHEGFYGSPRPNFYSPADREASLMGMAPPQGHNQYPLQKQNLNPTNFNARSGGYGANVMSGEQRKPDHPHDNQERYRVLLKHDGPEDRKRDWGTRSQVQETMEFDCPSRDTTFKNTWRDSSKAADEGILKYPEAANVTSRDITNHPVINKDLTLLEKVEGLNNKARVADGQFSPKEKPKAEGVASHEELNVSADDTNQESRNYRKESENAHPAKQKLNSREMDNESTEKAPSDSLVNTIVIGVKSGSLEFDASVDPNDQKAQRTKMREEALRRAKQRQQEEEERTREQKAKALAKLEELDRRTSAKTSNLNSSQTTSESSEVQHIAKQDYLTSATSSSDVTSSESSSVKDAKNCEVGKQVNDSDTEKPSFSSDFSSNVEANAKQSNVESLSSIDESNPVHFTASITIGTIEIKRNQMIKQKQLVASPSTSDVVSNNKDQLVQDNKNNYSSKNITNSTLNFPPQTQSSKSTSIPPEATNAVTVEVSSRPQAQRKVGRNQHANGTNKQGLKYQTTDAVMWAPVKSQIKNETSSHGASEKNPATNSSKLFEKNGNGLHNGSKAKRAEMERYVPKPAAKVHSPNVDSQHILPHKNSQAVEKAENYKHGKNAEPNNPLPQHVPIKSDPTNKAQISNFGWGDDTDNVLPSESLNSSVASKSYVSNKQKRQPHKTHKANVNNQSESINQHETSDISIQKASFTGYNERNDHPNTSAEHVKSHWQPKSQAKQKDASQGTNDVHENNNLNKNTVAAEIESQNQESGRARKVPEYANPNVGYNRGPHGNVRRGYNSNYRNHNDGEKRINYSDNQHVEYQRAGSYDKNKDYSENHKHSDGANEGARVTGSRYRGQGRNYHRGGGNFSAQSAAGISAKVGIDG